jgi:hypothetical protein
METMVHELAVNPGSFIGRANEEIWCTKMTRTNSQINGKTSCNGHNKVWALMVKAVGLQPSNAGQPGGGNWAMVTTPCQSPSAHLTCKSARSRR